MPCSPRTRGWSRGVLDPHQHADVLPAHAGMVPTCPHPRPVMIGAPRARGDGPKGLSEGAFWQECSPRTRGWSLDQMAARIRAEVLPAHAGMVPFANGPCR